MVKPEGKRPLGNLGLDRNDIRMDIQGIGWRRDWIDLRIGKSTGLCGRGIISSVFIMCVQFLDYLRKYQLLKKILPHGFSSTSAVIYNHISGRCHRHCTILTLGSTV